MSDTVASGRLAVILDTNVLLDWLVFCDPGVQPLAAAVESGAVRWLACARMRDELERTLDYPQLVHWAPDRERVLGRFDRHAQVVAAPATLPGLRCSDPDDQVFIDLAVAAGARWLVTHDRALHRLRRRAARLSVHIVRPDDWREEPDAPRP